MNPAHDEPDAAGMPDSGCSGGESFALQVLGNDMAPEFVDGEIIIVEPDGLLKDGSFVLARHGGEWMLRQLRRAGSGWALRVLDPALAERREIVLADLSAVHGVVIQKAVPGRRKASKFYI
ncbi:MAG TPA: S24 family peptidase [Burkholderiaceae bacterium]|nr:S24 family peptidase [Burkholderiaceae bacterium]